MDTTIIKKRGVLGRKRTLKEQELYDVVIALIEYNKVNPRKRWSDIAEKIMTILGMTIVYDENGEEVLYFDDEDKEFR